MNGILYRIINKVNNKSYIGKTYSNIYIRLKNHLSSKEDRPLYRAFRKYGTDKFTLEILGEYPKGILEEKEIEAIKLFNSFNIGYNCTLGGDGKPYLNLPEDDIIFMYTQLKLSINSISKELSVDWHSIERILVSSGIAIESNIDRARRTARKVIIEDINEIFNSSYECAQFLIDSDVTDSSVKVVQGSIIRVCNGERKSYKNLKLKWADQGSHDRSY